MTHCHATSTRADRPSPCRQPLQMVPALHLHVSAQRWLGRMPLSAPNPYCSGCSDGPWSHLFCLVALIVGFFCLATVVGVLAVGLKPLGLNLPGCLFPGRKRTSGTLQTASFSSQRPAATHERRNKEPALNRNSCLASIWTLQPRRAFKTLICRPPDCGVPAIQRSTVPQPSTQPQLLRAHSRHGQR